MKLGKAIIYFYNPNEEDEPLSTLKATLDSRDWINYEVFNYDSVNIGEWFDEIDLNDIEECGKEQTFLKYFTKNQKTIQEVSNNVACILNVSDFTGITFDEAVHMVNDKFKSEGKDYLELIQEELSEIKFKAEKILESWK